MVLNGIGLLFVAIISCMVTVYITEAMSVDSSYWILAICTVSECHESLMGSHYPELICINIMSSLL